MDSNFTGSIRSRIMHPNGEVGLRFCDDDDAPVLCSVVNHSSCRELDCVIYPTHVDGHQAINIFVRRIEEGHWAVDTSAGNTNIQASIKGKLQRLEGFL